MQSWTKIQQRTLNITFRYIRRELEIIADPFNPLIKKKILENVILTRIIVSFL